MWGFINEAGNVEAFSELPRNWRNVSNLFALADDTKSLKQLGWYPIIGTLPHYNPELQYRSDILYTFDEQNGVISQSATVYDIPQEDIQKRIYEQRESFLNTLRSKRDILLAGSDWTQAADIQNIKSDEWKQAWIEYRQWLRDLPQLYNEPPYNGITDINQVIWNDIPS